MYYKAVLALVIISFVSLNDALRILVFFPMASRSHSILGHGFVDNLLTAGHEVVHITSFPKDKPVANLREIDIGPIAEQAKKEDPDRMEQFTLKNMLGKGNTVDSVFFLYFTYDIHNRVLNIDEISNLLADPKEKFDAVILEWFFHDSIAGIAQLFQCPLIWMGSTEAHWQVLRLIDEIPNPSYNVDLFSVSSPPLTFWERIKELWTLVKKWSIINFIVVPFEKFMYNRIFYDLAAKRGVEIASYNEAVYNASLLFLNSHPSYGTPFRLPQNAKYIGGYHVNPTVKPLPKDIQKIMEDAKHGVIYFSMGSNLNSADMSTEMKQEMLKMFGTLKETVIWKFEENFEGVPPNVHLVEWAPQQSILAHPNLKMFITHGGQLSTTEAIHHGVPVVGIPVMGDQYVNMGSVENKGFGITVISSDSLVEDLAVALKKMLSNPSYKLKAKELSAIYHDRPIPPGKEMVHWVEHVVKTRGALHLRSPALLVPCYQKAYLDLALLILAVIALLVLIKRKLFSKSKETKKEKRN